MYSYKHSDRFLFLLVLFVLMGSFVKAQNPTSSIINSTGGSSTHFDITYEWSVGELALIETMVGSDYVLTNGLLQPYKISFVIQNDYNIVVNNILTPNGDGSNDTWVINNIDPMLMYDVTIYDRRGQQVFYSNNYQNNWDGLLSGQKLPEDTYYYVIKVVKSNITSVKNGYVTIVRD